MGITDTTTVNLEWRQVFRGEVWGQNTEHSTQPKSHTDSHSLGSAPNVSGVRQRTHRHNIASGADQSISIVKSIAFTIWPSKFGLCRQHRPWRAIRHVKHGLFPGEHSSESPSTTTTKYVSYQHHRCPIASFPHPAIGTSREVSSHFEYCSDIWVCWPLWSQYDRRAWPKRLQSSRTIRKGHTRHL